MKSEHTFEQIEKYLEGTMSAAERRDFENELATNEALREEVDFQKKIETMLAHQPEDDLRQNLQRLDKKYAKPSDNSNKNWLLGLFFVGIVGSAFWYFQGATNDLVAPVTEQPKEKTEVNAAPEKVEKGLDKTSIETPEIIEKEAKNNESEQKKIEKQPSNKSEQKVKSQPIAANFIPNEALEKRLGNLRSVGLELSNYKKQFLLKNGTIDFALAGTVSSQKNTEIVLYIFNNKMEDYEAFKPVFSTTLTLKEADDTFNIVEKIGIDAGLYYLQLEDETGEVLYLDKFLVE